MHAGGRGPPRATLAPHERSSNTAAVISACFVSTMPKTPKWAQMLGAEFSHGRRVQQPPQEEPPRPAAPSCDRDYDLTI